ncbi:GNAT family N-acetyltransferase [Sphingomonas sp. CROZ-RG-20F-R02-07]|uniref:GNAT family N-acetyltransferase n=1 Tax=Sphingomonas sp. CROZ-RG-20F-R02-07 TaxID=2914832 RepID=UPI003221FA20
MIELREDDPRAPHVAALLAFHRKDAQADSPPEFRHSLDADGLSAACVTFWTAWHDGALAGLCALKDLGEGAGEVKSMRTAPGQLRRGVGRAMLAHVMETARARGYRRLYLETGTSSAFAAASRLYEAAGFVDGPVFGGYPPSPHNRFMTISLEGSPCPPSS